MSRRLEFLSSAEMEQARSTCRAARNRGSLPRIHPKAVCAALLAFALVALSVVSVPHSSVAADPEAVSVFVRVVGPAEETSFGDTGEYETIWSGDVTVPSEAVVTAASGKQYRLFVEDGLYKATRLSDSQTWELGDGDDTLGATSVLAALHQASVDGGFSYAISDAWFPGAGLYIDSIAGFEAHGAVGWAYRVVNDTVAPTPSAPVDRFMLGYTSSEPEMPHNEVIFYWGYGSGCRPLRIAGPTSPVQCGEPVSFTIECFEDEGYSGTGTWEPVGGARVCVGDEYCVTDSNGIAEAVFQQSGQFTVVAKAAYDDEFYYIPSDGRLMVEVEGPCKVISFTVQDHGDPGLDFGAVVHGTVSTPELSQTADAGAVTLTIGPETNVDCSLQIKGAGGLEGPSGHAMAVGAIEWDTDSSGATSTPLTDSYVEVGTATAGVSTDTDLWLWLTIPGEQLYGTYSGELLLTAIEQGS